MSQAKPANTRIQRDTLYEELWKTPGTHLARKYGITYAVLGQVCRRHEIPRPPSGYWMMLKRGYDVERTPLPPITDQTLQAVEMVPVFAPQPNAEGAYGSSSEQRKAQRIRIPDDLSAPHPLVVAARKQLRAVSPDRHRLVCTNPKTAMDIRVGHSSVIRAHGLGAMPRRSV